MWHDYTRASTGAARRPPVVMVLSSWAAFAVVVALLAGCGTQVDTHPSTAAEAYALAHPSGQVPSSLGSVDLTREQIAQRVAGIAGDGVRILLPLRLPPSFAPAAPYIAVGDGTVRPNPEGWGTSYRVSYTDGSGLLVLTCGASSVPHGVLWSTEKLHIDGRPARAGRAGETVVVATTAGSPLIVITGGRVKRAYVLACAASLAPWR